MENLVYNTKRNVLTTILRKLMKSTKLFQMEKTGLNLITHLVKNYTMVK